MNQSIKKLFGEKLKSIRISRGLRQEELAEKINLDTKQISRLETGKNFTSLENLYNISKALNIDIKELFTFSNNLTDEIRLKKEIIHSIKYCKKDQLMLIYKIIKAVI